MQIETKGNNSCSGKESREWFEVEEECPWSTAQIGGVAVSTRTLNLGGAAGSGPSRFSTNVSDLTRNGVDYLYNVNEQTVDEMGVQKKSKLACSSLAITRPKC